MMVASATRRGVSLLAACVLLPGTGLAQTSSDPLPAVAVSPTNVLLPNYTSVPIGEVAGLEVGAFLARATDSSSTFYNPAGLTRAEKTSVSGTAGSYQWAAVSADGINSNAGSFQQVPALFAVALQNVIEKPKLSAGLSIARTVAWSQSIDLQQAQTAGSGANRLSYSAEGRLDSWLGSVGVGFAGGGRWRVGGSLDGQYTSLERRQGIADQYTTPAALSAFSVTSRNEGSAGHLRATVGAQYDATPTIALAAVIRTRGFGVFSSGFTMLEGTSYGVSGVSTASYFEDEPETAYKVPFEFKTGAAYVTPRAEFEVDLLVFSGAGEYTALTGDERVTVITSTSTRPAPVITTYPAAPATIDSRAVVNIAMGGHFELTGNGAWVVHGGYGTDRSPVGPNDTMFTKVHLQKFTAGVSGRTSRFLGSLGVQYLWGTSPSVTLRELPIGALTTKFRVRNFGVVYSLAVTL